MTPAASPERLLVEKARLTALSLWERTRTYIADPSDERLARELLGALETLEGSERVVFVAQVLAKRKESG